ncbi:o-succinylbenzoate synthase [Aquirufa aurantiipilula]|uniref:O-succinylbenzoate synthase n=1 Tax=Aquirufa aurantiipilula TaxID=2696561 RepID=A0ABT6BHN4_9BACT|nr:o-succinylbenzoate synthase [Aquirufa aurantiipilula]MDF5689972.1 o-succinylbenzoate synthase [Aquirufa aurantiipilula]
MFDISVSYQKHSLQFHFEAGTSRGVLTEKNSYFIQIKNKKNPTQIGIGEAGPLRGLSPEFEVEGLAGFEKYIKSAKWEYFPETLEELPLFISHLPLGYPSYKFAIEMAVVDYIQAKNGIFFKNEFSLGKMAIPINGLIWMGKPDFMEDQIEEKIAQGYTCLKLKIGAIDFDQELAILKNLRSQFPKEKLLIRVDANGAFSPKEAAYKLEQLAKLDIHSIEQPIRAGLWNAMADLCQENILPIALDEELIGLESEDQQNQLLDKIPAQYFIIKPSLVGGFSASHDWIQAAEKRQMGWWITSALESNIGLQAIAQFTAEYSPQIPQGLGTGSLYTNNFASGLLIQRGKLHFNPNFLRVNPFHENHV